mmetsp:Transcript_36062/g.36746  ORF Transcript_36062/g.36746 Transcript_36062/m.36746 type:complete len:298 (-) Transcript_36062:38-931(-)
MVNDSPKESRFSPVVTDFVAGSVAGCVSIFTGHPIDTVKVRMQSSSAYTSGIQCARNIIANEGFYVLYRGLLPPLLTSAVVSAAVFTTYGYTLEIMKGRKESASYFDMFIAGLVSGIPCGIISTPVELIKIQEQINPSKFGQPWQCAYVLTKKSGIFGLFRGLNATVCREVPAFGIYFLSYEIITDKLQESTQMKKFFLSFLSGGLAGALSWGVVYPIDVVKTNLQLMTVTPNFTSGEVCVVPTQNVGIIQMANILVQQHGWRYLFRGLNVTLFRSLPVNAVVFPTYHLTTDLLEAV